MRKILPWNGIALIILSIGLFINSISFVYLQYKVNHLQYKVNEIQSITNMNIQTDKELFKVIKQLTQNQENIMHQINIMKTESPTNCLQEHAELLKNYLELLTNYKDLLIEVKKFKESN